MTKRDKSELNSNLGKFRKPQVFRDRIDLFDFYDEADFIARYRLSKDNVIDIMELIGNRLEHKRRKHSSVSPIQQLLVVLRFYSTGNFQLDNADLFGISQPTILRIVQKACNINSVLDIPWENLMPVLMDSCNVMRSSKSGLEKILRDKATHMLDIDGDSCHHIHNATKKFCDPFNYWVEGLHTDLHNDFRWSQDLQEGLEEICFILGVKYTMPARFVSHRWLLCYDITIDNMKLMSAFAIFYYAFLPVSDKPRFQHHLLRIYLKKDLSSDAKDRIRQIQHILSVRKLTEDGKNRKQRILGTALYQQEADLFGYESLCRCVAHVKEIMLAYELREPRIHLLFEDQKQLLMDFLSCFIKQEVIVGKTARELKVLELRPNMMRKSHIFVGSGNMLEVQQHSQKFDKDLDVFLDAAAKAN
ncbi:hypothetical protein KUTeg_007881 [Tegillarca granosa]|uniref:Uncharacterized protein n=1 Tax=Tegillarca granosa TaxID=220873 RepID=A0ABQ9FHS8_TEGGR|nr:hypothetical protein KUTeg_007881 [Tegillarca granosa]